MTDERRFDVGIIGGCGHVGLPLALALASRGASVVAVDTAAEAVSQVRAGVMPFCERGGPALLERVLASGLLAATDQPQALAACRTVVLVIGTPIDHHLTPAFTGIQHVLDQYLPHLRSAELLVLRSTMYPGTSERVWRWAQESGLQAQVAVCPERIAQGAALEEVFKLPQIVASFTPQGEAAATRLFRLLTDEIVTMAPMEAELAKLFCNAWRYVKFAAANQFFTIAHDLGADFDRIYAGMTYHYPRVSDLPRPGFAAGPCLFKDTMQLAACAEDRFPLGHAAMQANEGLPRYLLAHMRRRFDLRSQTVGILGMAFKADVDDPRDSLSFKLKELMELEARRVLCSDPFLRGPDIVQTEAAVREADVIVIATPHSAYRSLETMGKPVVDIWNVLGQGVTL